MVGAVVAAFRPGPELLAGVGAALAQVRALVVVVDEHPVSDATRVVVEQVRHAGADVVEHPANRGIGAALNTGLARLSELVPDLTDVLTLDQDSAVPDGYVPALVDAGARARAAGVRVGMVADALPPRLRKPVLLACLVLALAFTAYLTWAAGGYLWRGWRSGEMTQGMIEIATWIPQTSLVVGALLLCVAVADELVLALKAPAASLRAERAMSMEDVAV